MLAAPRVGLLADGVEGDGRLRVEARLDLRGAFANQQELRPVSLERLAMVSLERLAILYCTGSSAS